MNDAQFNLSAPVLLLTSSVYVAAPFVQLTEPRVRAELILESLGHWLRIDPNLRIVICDGSGYSFHESVVDKFPLAQIECLVFKNDENAVARHGKGYGEGQIIEYALQNSRYLRKAKSFAKCTGKLWVENYQQVVKGFKGKFNCQLSVKDPANPCKIRPSFVDTRFYLSDIDYYKQNFIKSYLAVRDSEGYYLEHCFKDILINHHLPASRLIFRTPPDLRGVSGSSGVDYGRENLKKRWFTNRLKESMLGLRERLLGVL